MSDNIATATTTVTRSRLRIPKLRHGRRGRTQVVSGRQRVCQPTDCVGMGCGTSAEQRLNHSRVRERSSDYPGYHRYAAVNKNGGDRIRTCDLEVMSEVLKTCRNAEIRENMRDYIPS